MISDFKEDQAVVSEQEIEYAIKSNNIQDKLTVIKRVLDSLNEKRDAYHDIVNSLIYMVDAKDVELEDLLTKSLIDVITSQPMRYAGKMFITKAQNRLLSERPLFVEKLFEQLVERTDEWSKNFSSNNEVLRIQILSLKSIKKAEENKKGRPTQLPQERIDKLCKDAILSCDDSTKIDTFSLIFESRSTTRVLTNKEFSMFKALFKDALSFQEPALRQVFLSVTNKIFIRLRDSHRAIMRDRKTRDDLELKKIHNSYMQFLKWTIEFCFDSIYCNAYFGSFILTISTLKYIIQHITFSDASLPIEEFFNSKRSYDSILSCLNDSFEENKRLALDLLDSLPYNEQFISEDNIESFEKIAYQLVDSVNPAHSLTCQYVFKLVIRIRSKLKGNCLTRNQLLLHHLIKLTNLVEDGVKDTKDDFIYALKSKPIYPKLSCIRSLLNDIDTCQINQDRESWERLADRLIMNSIGACSAVSTIVCNLNPETIGHLPMDLKPLDAQTLSTTLHLSLNISDSKLSTITSQMLLICGWKTIKECSLSLGAMCICFWWPRKQNKSKNVNIPETEPILNYGQILKIIEFFNHYLTNLRHRGAFEQAYNGFMIVTKRIWLDEKYKHLLVDTLGQILNDFKTEALDEKKIECLKAYVTRRSAGLPFIVQAILNAEHKHDSQTLRQVVNCLFTVLERENSQVYQRIHCLNILRAIIKETSLGEKVLPYIGRTLTITLESFRSESFSIRNCANMLLKSLMDRTFGVNRLRTDIHRKNQLSFERFFTECPNLHKRMLQHLYDGLVDRKCLAVVHGVFIVLFRLKPSLEPSEEYNAEKMIKPLIEPITTLSRSCPDYKLRELAAKLSVRLQNFCTYDDKLSNPSLEFGGSVLDLLQNSDHNKLHGSLLIMKSWIETEGANTNEKFRSISKQVIQQVCNSNLPSALKLTALDLAESYCLNFPSDRQFVIKLSTFFLEWMKIENNSEPLFENLIFKSFTLCMMAAFSGNKDESENKKLELDSDLKQLLDLLPLIITRPPTRTYSANLQASLIRFIRQLLAVSDEFVDDILNELDIDSTAAHNTPYDKIKLREENDSEKDKLVRYCEQDVLRNYMRQTLPIPIIFNLTHYDEFKSLESEKLKFSPKFTNTPRSIEILALASKNWCQFNLSSSTTWFKEGESHSEKLYFLSHLITNLPDCDTKCLALLCAGKLIRSNIELGLNVPSEKALEIQNLKYFSEIIDELTDGDHTLTVRKACAEVLNLTLDVILQKKCKQYQAILMNLFSALIKLSQDEEKAVRSLGQSVMLDLGEHSDSLKLENNLLTGSHLDNLIKLIVFQQFDSRQEQDVNQCFELLMRIIFNHSKNYSTNIHEEKERLFDKTRLNTFADHVATIQSSFAGLKVFFDTARTERLERFNLDLLVIPKDILRDLILVETYRTNEETGDYSWRLNKVKADLINSQAKVTDETDNNQLVDKIILDVLKSLDYFSDGYVNVLTDTEYIYHELSLYKRIALVEFISQHTYHKLKNINLMSSIHRKLSEICSSACCTTLICKSLELIKSQAITV